jgi:hypothetical protein
VLLLARRLDIIWGQLNGRLRANGGPPLTYDTPVIEAMNLCYFTAVEWMDRDARLEFDGHVTVTCEMLADFEHDQRERRMQLARSLGEVVSEDGSGTE